MSVFRCSCLLGLGKLLFPQPSTVVLLRHGEREDYMAEKAVEKNNSSPLNGGWVSRESYFCFPYVSNDFKYLKMSPIITNPKHQFFNGYQAGRGAHWIRESSRPWDPPLAPNGKKQAESAAKRLRQAGGTLGTWAIGIIQNYSANNFVEQRMSHRYPNIFVIF